MQHTVYMFDGFQLDVSRRTLASSGGLVLPVNSRAMDTLLLLVANAGKLVDKRLLMETVWPNAVVEDNNLNQCIGAIRKVLGETAGSNRYVMTVPGRGYCFVCPARAVSRESEPAPEMRSKTLPRRLILQATLVAICAAATAVLTLSGRQPVDGSAPARLEDAPPAIILRLHPAPAADHIGAGPQARTSLTRCLSQQPGIRLRVLLQLVPANADTPVWSGEYSASAEDILSLQEEQQRSDDRDCSARTRAGRNP